MLSKRKPKNSTKNLFVTLQVKIIPLVNKLEYTNIKRTLQNLIYPMYLSPPRSSYQQTSRSIVFISYLDLAILPDCIRQVSPASFNKSQILPKFQNTLYTLNRCRLCLGTNLISRYNNERGEGEETTKEFSLKNE